MTKSQKRKRCQIQHTKDIQEDAGPVETGITMSVQMMDMEAVAIE